MTNVVYACCSSKRSKMIIKKTLATLSRGRFKGELIVCVPHEEVDTYKAELDADKDNRINIQLIGAPKGQVAQRKYVRSMLPEGQRICFMDDDIAGIKVLCNEELYNVGNIEEVVEYCFNVMPDECLLWGVYPVSNVRWMKNRVSIGNCLIVGAFYGCINSPELKEVGWESETEDYFRALGEQQAGRPPMRFEWIGIMTNYFKNSGGLAPMRKENPAGREKALEELMTTYPGMIHLRVKRNGLKDVAFDGAPRRIKSAVLSVSDGSDTEQASAPSASAQPSPECLILL